MYRAYNIHTGITIGMYHSLEELWDSAEIYDPSGTPYVDFDWEYLSEND